MILLDTHVLLWLVLGDARLKAALRRRIASAPEIAVSAITFWEVATLLRLGRVRAIEPAAGWRAAVLSLGVIEIPVSAEIAWTAGAMDHAHGDPADRLIMATSLLHSARLATADGEILKHRRDLSLIDAR